MASDPEEDRLMTPEELADFVDRQNAFVVEGGVFDGEQMTKLLLEKRPTTYNMKIMWKNADGSFTGHDVRLRPKVMRDELGREIWEDVGFQL